MQTWLLILAPHGVTDIFDFEWSMIIFFYGLGQLITMVSPLFLQFVWLYLFSIVHIKNDFRHYPWSSSILLHLPWLFNKNIAITYLTFIHTPLHYRRSFLNGYMFSKLVTIIIFTYICSLCPRFELLDYHQYWIGVILGHIFLHELT
jgi:hypothetical protein